MKLNCLSCGHAVDLRDAYDDYDGPVKCCICGALLIIRTEEGQVKRMDLLGSRQPEEPVLGRTVD